MTLTRTRRSIAIIIGMAYPIIIGYAMPIMEHRYREKWSAAMLGDYCWTIKWTLLKQNTIDRPKWHVVKVSNFLFTFIVHPPEGIPTLT
jgi:hypothetical protein